MIPRLLLSVKQFNGLAWRLGLGLLICGFAGRVVFAEEGLAGEKIPDKAQVAEWVLQLDDNLYAIRKSAQESLEGAGQVALETVSKEANSGSLESSTRALNIMLAWTESTDHQLQIATLEELVLLPNRPIEAGLAAELLANAREQFALEAFVALGGRIEAASPQQQIIRVQSLSLKVIIDPKWKGELEGLVHLEAMRHATIVSFHSAPLDDGVLPHLVSMPNIRLIEFFGTKMSAETIEQLKKQIPNISIEVRSGALLGIHGEGHRQGPVLIVKVAPNSAAAKAGLLKNDMITELAGDAIRDFPDLTRRIGKFQAGDTVELTISRNGQLMKKKVTFDKWGENPLVATNRLNPRQRNPLGLGRPVPASPGIILDRR